MIYLGPDLLPLAFCHDIAVAVTRERYELLLGNILRHHVSPNGQLQVILTLY